MKWKVLESEELIKLGLFKIRRDRCELPDGRIMPKYYVVEFPHWEHVIALTEGDKMVLVDQYRHAAERRFLELPGGTYEPGKNETVAQAALRELEEETGYSGELELIGTHYPNPALQTNEVYVYISRDCKKCGPQNLDPFEDIDVKLLPINEVYNLAQSGEIGHGLMLASLLLAKNHIFNL